MHYLLELSSSANPDLNFWVSKLSKNSVLGVQMTCWTHRWLSPWYPGKTITSPHITGSSITCLKHDQTLGSGKRQPAVSGNALDNSAVGSVPNLWLKRQNIFMKKILHIQAVSGNVLDHPAIKACPNPLQTLLINPSNAEATFLQRMQSFLKTI